MEYESLLRQLKLLRKKWKVVLLFCIAGALTAYTVSLLFLPKVYESQALLFIATNGPANESSMKTAGELADSYIIILQNRTFLTRVENESGVSLTTPLSDTLFISKENNTPALRIKMQSRSPEDAKTLCRTLLACAPEELTRVIGTGSGFTIVEDASDALFLSPNSLQNGILGGMAGVLLAVLLVLSLRPSLNRPRTGSAKQAL